MIDIDRLKIALAVKDGSQVVFKSAFNSEVNCVTGRYAG